MNITLTAQEAIEMLGNRMTETQFSAVSGQVSEELQRENTELENRLECLRVENARLLSQIEQTQAMAIQPKPKPKPHPLLMKLHAIERAHSGIQHCVDDSFRLIDSKGIVITFGELKALAKELEGV